MVKENYEDQTWEEYEEELESRTNAEEDEEESWDADDELNGSEQGFIKGYKLANRKDPD